MNWNRKPQTGWRLITGPVSEVISLEAAKLQLRVTNNAQDDLIERNISIARAYIESRGQILSTQVWETLLDEFPCDGIIPIWKSPVQSVDSVSYLDPSGAGQTWSTDSYHVARGSYPTRITLLPATSWPSVQCQPEAITIRLTLGYNSSPVSVPWQLIGAMHLLIGHLQLHREAVIDGSVTELPIGMEDLIDSAIGRARVY